MVKSRSGYRYDYPEGVGVRPSEAFGGQEQELEYFSRAGLHADVPETELELSGVLCVEMDSSGRVQAGVAAGVQEEGIRQGAGGFL